MKKILFEKRELLLFATLVVFVSSGYLLIQTSTSFQNGDFELGNLDGWSYDGQVAVVSVGTDAATDNHLQRVAEGQYSAMVGDDVPWMSNDENQESYMEQTIQLQQSISSDTVLEFAYAVVANDPPDHPDTDKPRFRVLVSDLSSNKLLLDTEYLYTNQTSNDWYLGAGSTNSVWNQPYYTLAGDRWVFRPWKLESIPLSGLEGHVLTIRFEVRDCNYGAHAIYGLLDRVRIGRPSNSNLPDLEGDPQQAIYVNPPFWAPLLHWLEQWGIIWLCCLIPLLLLGLILYMLLRRKPRVQEDFMYVNTPEEKKVEPKISGGIRKNMDDDK
jgi:hypothetical protein